MKYFKLFEKCSLCPRNCGINRSALSPAFKTGFCNADDQLRVAHIGAHFGEEPPISGTKGSGTIFFSGCSLKCSFCQNYQISRDDYGKLMDTKELLSRVIDLIRLNAVHNINFVTPDHFFPFTFELVEQLRKKGHCLPVVYNLSGYQSVPLLTIAEEYADIYLPDYKYSDSDLSRRLSRCNNYPTVALDAIVEMVKQKGFLDSFSTGERTATRGVLVRHMILPGEVKNSIDALSSLFIELGPELPISLMSQYFPVLSQEEKNLNRTVAQDEFNRVYSHVKDLGFSNIYIQYLDQLQDESCGERSFLPDFRLPRPFMGNMP